MMQDAFPMRTKALRDQRGGIRQPAEMQDARRKIQDEYSNAHEKCGL